MELLPYLIIGSGIGALIAAIEWHFICKGDDDEAK